MTTSVSFELNGDQVTVETSPERTLRELLREELDTYDVKRGCRSGRCGVCTVLLDGDAVKSCLVMAPKVDGCQVRTVSDLGTDGQLHPVQDAFVEEFAIQCGYCTPGFVLTAVDFLSETETFDREEAKRAIKGNVCRCTGYEKILDAIESCEDDDSTEPVRSDEH